MSKMEMKNISVYRVGFCSQRNDGEELRVERVFAFDPETTESQIKTILFDRLWRVSSIDYIDEIEQDVICW